jgi:hypothetical protein
MLKAVLSQKIRARYPLLIFCLLSSGNPLFYSRVPPIAIVRSLTVDMSAKKELYRPDGIRINYDPYSPEMLEKYGSPGATDSEGKD